jgi:hypothetical protein
MRNAEEGPHVECANAETPRFPCRFFRPFGIPRQQAHITTVAGELGYCRSADAGTGFREDGDFAHDEPLDL